MRRTMLIVVLTAIAAAATAASVTTILSDDDGFTASTATLPTPTQVATENPRTPEPTITAAPTPSPTEEGEPTPPPTSSARSVDCTRQPRFCSETHGMSIQGGRYAAVPVDEADSDYEGSPTISMKSKVIDTDKSEAEAGDKISSIHVEVVVENNTQRTFVFENREIVLELRRNGRVFDVLETKGEGFEMTPDGKMTGTFDRPITMDGTYTWQAKTWYEPK